MGDNYGNVLQNGLSILLMFLHKHDYTYTSSMTGQPHISVDIRHGILMGSSLSNGLALVVYRIGPHSARFPCMGFT
jgi:hypothetical protein